MSESKSRKANAKTSDDIRYQNEMIKREYFAYLKGAGRYSDSSIGTYERAILLWQEFNKNADFRGFNKDRAAEFKAWLDDDKGLSPTYRYHTLRKLKGFLLWLSKQRGYKGSINPTDIDFLNLSRKESLQASQETYRRMPSVKDVETVLSSIEPKTEVDLRDRAFISLLLLTGIRISAAVSLPIKSFDREKCIILQYPKFGVDTKFAKPITTAFFPTQSGKPKQYFLEWCDYLVNERGFQDDDPIFPMTKVAQGEKNVNFHSCGEVAKQFWGSSGPARKMFTRRFLAAGVGHHNPHAIRHLLVSEFSKMPLTELQKKAISKNLGHENVGTTFGEYGAGRMRVDQQIDLVSRLDPNTSTSSDLSDQAAAKIAKHLAKELKQ